MSSGEEENDECIEHSQLDETDPVFRSVAEADVSLDEMMSLACRQGKLDIVELLLESGAHVDYRNKAGNTPLLEACSQGHVDVARYLLDHNANIDAPTETTSDSALTWACTLGNEPIVELLLEKTSNVEHRTKDGCTALMFAALAGHVKVAAMLLDHSAEINVESDSNKDSPLTFACWKGHCDVVELLLEREANIEHRTKEGFTPLMFAALGGHTDVARKLLERGAKVNVPSGSNNDIPLTSACWKGHHDVVKLLLEFTSNIEHRTKDGCTPLMLAAREGHYSVAKLILDSNAEVNVPSGSENNIPLTLACWKGHTNVVELLLEHKSNIEHRNKAGCTPLMLASREGHVETTSLLLNKGAEINTPSGSNDDTPLTLACWKGHVEVVDLLLRHNSKVDHQTKTGCTPLMEATREGHVAVAEQLLSSGADVELPDNYGQSPLFMACWKGHRDVAELLLENVANRDCRTKTGITPLFQACRENHVDVVELLLDYGASVNAPFPNSRENPLTLAGEKGHVELVSLLLSRSANVECHTKKGCTPFHLACKEGHLDIGVQLLEKGADTEASDLRNNTPIVASMKNGHVEVVEWLIGVVNHLPSEDLCQKCLVAPVDDKEKHDDMMLGRTKCYDLVTKAKKAREQKVQRNTEIFLKELEHEKEREDIRKKKAAAKRRDKRKRKKAAKDTDPQTGVQPGEDFPLENRPQELLVEDSEHDLEECENDVVDTTRTATDEPLMGSGHKEVTIGTREPLARPSLKNRQITDNDTNQLKITTCEDRAPQVANHCKPKRPLSTGGISTPRNSMCSTDRGHQRNSSSGKDSESKNYSLQDKTFRRRSDELIKLSKKKINPHRSEKVESEKMERIEIKTKTLSEVTQSQTVNCVKPDVKRESKAEKPLARKELADKTSYNSASPKKNSHSKQQTGASPTHTGSKSSSPRDSKSSPESSQAPARRPKDGSESVASPDNPSLVTESSRTATKGASTASHSPGGSRTVQSEGEREHKPVHSPRSKQHPQVGRGEDNWKEVTRNTNSKTVIFQLTAPNALCGRVIGRGGSKINSITEESGAQITIGKPEPKNPTDRVITIKGSSKAVQKAKFLVTQALNTPSTMGQTTPTTSTATTSNAMSSSSDRADTSTSPAPVRGNYAAIPSSPADWPTIEQANNMAVQTQPTKTPVLSKDGKPRDEMKSSPELSEGSQEAYEQGVVVVASNAEDVTTSNTEEALTLSSTSPVASDPAWSSSSTTWKPYHQPPQSMGVCTSAVTTSGSSSISALNSKDSKRKLALVKPSGSDITPSYGPFPVQSGASVQGLTQPRHRVLDNNEPTSISSQESWESKSHSPTPSSVTTVSISTSAAMTTTHRDLHITPDEPPNNLASSVRYGAIGSNKKGLQDSPRNSDLSGGPFGIIGEVASGSIAFQNDTVASEFTSSQQEGLLQNRSASSSEGGSGLLPSPRQQNKPNFPCFSPWASQTHGISDIGSESFSSGRQMQGTLPGMEYFTGSSSLFSSGSLSSYPWSTGEDGDENAERSRNISWSGQQPEYQGEHQFIAPVQEKFSPLAQKSGSEATVNMRTSELHADSGSFKPMSGSIWGPPVNQQAHASSLSVIVCDDESPEKQAWNNSDSTSSSRSSSRQELSSIMDTDGPKSGSMWSSSAFGEDLTPTPQEGLVGLSAPLSDQGIPSGSSQWVPGRAAYSAPSSPSLPRTHNLPESAPPSMGGHPSVDDLAVRSWASKQRSPRSLSSSEPSTGWTGNLPMPVRRSSVDLSQSVVSENSIPAHPWQHSRPVSQGYPPGLTMRKNWREQSQPQNNSEITLLLQQLGLEKYLPVFEEHNIDGTRLAQMVEEDLENLGIPKGPRLKLLFAVHGRGWPGGNSFQPPGNGFVKTDPTPPIIQPTKKLTKIEQPPLLNNHNHILPHHGEVHLSPSGHKKQSLKQVLNPPFSQPPGNHGNQHLLSLMTSPGRGMNPAHHVGLVSQSNHGNSLPPQPHSASGNINTSQAYLPVSSHGEQQTLPFVTTQQGPYVNHVPYTQTPQVFYPGGFYFYYPQQ